MVKTLEKIFEDDRRSLGIAKKIMSMFNESYHARHGGGVRLPSIANSHRLMLRDVQPVVWRLVEESYLDPEYRRRGSKRILMVKKAKEYH